jgi:hypothetical protein
MEADGMGQDKKPAEQSEQKHIPVAIGGGHVGRESPVAQNEDKVTVAEPGDGDEPKDVMGSEGAGMGGWGDTEWLGNWNGVEMDAMRRAWAGMDAVSWGDDTKGGDEQMVTKMEGEGTTRSEDGDEQESDGPADESDGPADESDGPADESDGPADESDGPADESDGPADESDGPADESDGPSDEAGGKEPQPRRSLRPRNPVDRFHIATQIATPKKPSRKQPKKPSSKPSKPPRKRSGNAHSQPKPPEKSLPPRMNPNYEPTVSLYVVANDVANKRSAPLRTCSSVIYSQWGKER